MSSVTRNDIYVRDEKGPDWFDDFLRSLANSERPKTRSIQEILNAITNKKGETVDGVVKEYRERVGLDLVQSNDETEETVKQASVKNSEFRPLSIRHAEEQSVVDRIKDDSNISAALDSICRHSGGTKKVQSLISFLREHLGDDVSFSDDELVKFLEDLKDKFRENKTDEFKPESVGLIGAEDSTERDDDTADYIKNDGVK